MTNLKKLEMTAQIRTGIEAIDLQHEKYFHHANELLQRWEAADPSLREEVDEQLNFIWLYIIEHFSTEEEIMLKYDYPHYKAHHAKHQAFRNKFEAFRNKTSKEGFDSMSLQELVYLLRDWFYQQIKRDDVLLAKFLNEEMKRNQGLKGFLSKIVKKITG